MRKLAFLYPIVALACLVAFGCSLEPFDMPSWDVEINLPVLTEDYTFQDLAADEEAIKVVSDSLCVEITEALTEVDLAGRFGLAPYEGEFGARIGAFEVTAVGSAAVSFTIGEVWEDAAAFSGHVQVPPFCFPAPGGATASRTIDLGDDFVWAEVESGVLGITVENGMQVPLGDPSRGCPLVLRLDWWGAGSDSVAFDEPVPPGESAGAWIDLAGRTISNSVTISLRGGSPGSEGEVDFSYLDEIGIEVAPGGLTVSRALAKLPAQAFESERSIIVEDSTRVVLAGIESGTLALTLFNGLPVELTVGVTSDDLTRGGEPLAAGADIPALGQEALEIDLSGYTLDTGAVPGDPWYGTNTVTFRVSAETPGATQHVEVASTDSVRIVVGMRDVVFDRITGTLKPTAVDISGSYDLDLPDICSAVSVSGASLVLRIHNEAMIGGEFEVMVTGEGGGRVESATLTGAIVPADLGGAPSEVEYEYDGGDVQDLVSIVPDRIEVEGEATVQGRGRIYGTDALRGDLTITVPLVFEVEGDTVRLDARGFDIPEEVRDEIRDAARDMVFRGGLVTDFDLRGAFNVYLAADSAAVYTAPLLSIAEPGGLARFGAGVADNEFEVHLDRESLEVFLRERLYMGLEVILDPTETPVTARPDNYLRLEGRLCLVRRMGS